MSFVIHCGTSDCDWGKKMQALSEAQLDPCYSEFRKHCIQIQACGNRIPMRRCIWIW